jgi:hypothetical protein
MRHDLRTMQGDSSPCGAIRRRATRVVTVADRVLAVRRDRPSAGAIGGRAARSVFTIDAALHTSGVERNDCVQTP